MVPNWFCIVPELAPCWHHSGPSLSSLCPGIGPVPGWFSIGPLCPRPGARWPRAGLTVIAPPSHISCSLRRTLFIECTSSVRARLQGSSLREEVKSVRAEGRRRRTRTGTRGESGRSRLSFTFKCFRGGDGCFERQHGRFRRESVVPHRHTLRVCLCVCSQLGDMERVAGGRLGGAWWF